MTKWLETLALDHLLAVILRLLVNFLFLRFPIGEDFNGNNFGSLGNRLPILYEKKIT